MHRIFSNWNNCMIKKTINLTTNCFKRRNLYNKLLDNSKINENPINVSDLEVQNV